MTATRLETIQALCRAGQVKAARPARVWAVETIPPMQWDVLTAACVDAVLPPGPHGVRFEKRVVSAAGQPIPMAPAARCATVPLSAWDPGT